MGVDELMRLREAALEAEHGGSTSRNRLMPPSEWRLGKPGDPATCEPFTVMWNGTGQAVVSTIRRPVGEYFLAMHQQLPAVAELVKAARAVYTIHPTPESQWQEKALVALREALKPFEEP